MPAVSSIDSPTLQMRTVRHRGLRGVATATRHRWLGPKSPDFSHYTTLAWLFLPKARPSPSSLSQVTSEKNQGSSPDRREGRVEP